ncbi:MAG: D-alanine--D-alanine ligase [Rickettsiales bacterium]|nr:D-alanine--D-alanine ligase [Pseudomonadota bacterium]MDA0967379.1 D-alanine--D-alanine ligase [Pseudomonadota bacterium]MDG4544403.1 D-alanine--D-alanine ligase [Rickettsiales bacterium]MDG4546533.1 D-alanine--D-alanine ligase [Rickettsiales bacterium]MDG4548678.1 D-alanine--D-alanine ligase [Rickettsiales bacterium]
MTKKHVALLVGGLSSEREVSLMSGKGVEISLKELGYKVTVIDVGRDIAKKLEQAAPDVAFIALHGTYGEDGCIQGLLELTGIPYTHSGVMASAIAMNKLFTKHIGRDIGITFPKHQICTPEEITGGKIQIPRPFVIKPVSEGSSICTYIVKEGDKLPEYEDIKQYKRFLVEQYIKGRELTVAVADFGSLGVLELKPKKGFYDYKNKYSSGTTDYRMPADIDKNIYDEAMESSYKLHQALECRGITRTDLILSDNGNLYFLEINTHPGLTEFSLVPKIAKHAGMSYAQLVEYLVENASCKK